jgi:hypothetical protein
METIGRKRPRGENLNALTARYIWSRLTCGAISATEVHLLASRQSRRPASDPTLRFSIRDDSCCILVTPILRESDMLMRAEGDCMFDVYLNEKRDRLLVVAKG